MKAIRCSNGHWYDEECYDKCPHCGQTSTVAKGQTEKEGVSGKKGLSLFGKGKKAKKDVVPEMISTSSVASKSKTSSSVTHDEVTERFFADIDDDKTESMFEAAATIPEAQATVESPISNNGTTPKSISEPLATAVRRVSAMDDGKTMGYFNAMTQNNSSADLDDAPQVVEPVVGWLVAISGAHLGESFSLHVGKNTIGRNENNKVVLRLDKSVSRVNHATIIYEPKKREFYLQSGNSEGLAYLNDTFINGMQPIGIKDVVEVGSTKLIFIPLCGADFSWEQYM